MEDPARTYPVLHLMVSHGHGLAIAVAITTLAFGIGLWFAGASIVFLIGGIVGGAFMYLLMKSYVELVRVIVDMLLPK